MATYVMLTRVDPEVVVELLHAWNHARCRPPLPDKEVLRCVDNIVHMHARGHGAPDREPR